MNPLPKKSKEDDSDSLFDFLDGEKKGDAGEPVEQTSSDAQSQESTDEAPEANQPRQREPSESPFPVIRKPVSISKSGALKAPLPDQPVEAPPPLTDGVRATNKPSSAPLSAKDTPTIDDLDDDLGRFFDIGAEEEDWPDSEQWLGDKNKPGGEQWLEEEGTSHSEPWIDDAHRPIVERHQKTGGGWVRRSAYAVAFLFIAAGLLATIYSVPQVQQWSQDTVAKVSGLISPDGSESDNSIGASGNRGNADTSATQSAETSIAGALSDEAARVDGAVDSPKSLNTLFNEELAKIELLVEQGDLDGAESALQTMDPLVFGYGSTEFTDIQNQLGLLKEQPGSTDGSSRIVEEQGEQVEGDTAQALDVQAQDQQQVEAELAEAASQAEQLAEQEQEDRRLELERQSAEAAEEEQLRADRLAQEKARAEQFRIALEERTRNEEQLEEQRLEEQRLEALRIEEERLAELRAEVQRLEEQRLEEQRLAEQRAEEQRAEEQRRAEQLAEEQRRAEELAEEQRRAEELAQQLAEEQRLAELRQEELRAEEQRLAEQRAEEQRLAELREEELRQEEQRLARQAAEELAQSQEAIAARQREAARQQRLADARANESQQEPASVDTSPDTAAPVSDDLEVAVVESIDQQTPANSARPIAEAELQQVYRQFSELETAIESRDINAVVRLTESSGSRIQQVLQIFENNVSIEAQLRNVSTLDSAGEIRGTLEITRLQRVDGSVTGPPRNFESVPILSVREGGEWSQIRW